MVLEPAEKQALFWYPKTDERRSHKWQIIRFLWENASTGTGRNDRRERKGKRQMLFCRLTIDVKQKTL